MFFGDTV